MFSRTHVAQDILACLYSRAMTGEGALMQISMLERILDFQFEVLICFYNDGKQLPVRSSVNSGHAYISAPCRAFTKSNIKALFLNIGMEEIKR